MGDAVLNIYDKIMLLGESWTGKKKFLKYAMKLRSRKMVLSLSSQYRNMILYNYVTSDYRLAECFCVVRVYLLLLLLLLLLRNHPSSTSCSF